MGLALGKLLLFMVVVAAARLIKHYTATRVSGAPAAIRRLVGRLKGKESLFAVVLVFVIAFASLSETLGLDFLIGAFFGSMLLSHRLLGIGAFREIETTATNVIMGFLGPIFFAAVGLPFDATALRNWPLATVILVASFAGKILGGYLGGRLAGMPKAESRAVGAGLNGRGVMELVIANIALSNGFIGKQLFTILVSMALITTFVTPILLGRAFRRIGDIGAPVPG